MYAEIFKDVVTIMREDYAGCCDKKVGLIQRHIVKKLQSLSRKKS